MLSIDSIYEMMEDADKLASCDVSDLRQIVRQFPYFQSAHKLLLRKLSNDADEEFDEALKQSSVYIGDRAKLYFYLNENSNSDAVIKEQSLPDLSLITTNLGDADSNISVSGGSIADASFNYLFLSEDEMGAINKEKKSKSMESGEIEVGAEMGLIDKFMSAGGGKISPNKDQSGPLVNLAEDSVKENPAILTETLARIYIKQKKYDKAIDIFNNLSLKFPEKSAYFADRIKELDILIKSS